MKLTNWQKGRWAEFYARMLFRCKGYHIIAHNYKTGIGTHAGEIDFIATKGKTIVFVEVKKRSSFDNAAEAILPQQQQRIVRGAEAFLQKHQKYKNYNARFDAVFVVFPLRILHLKNAWIIS